MDTILKNQTRYEAEQNMTEQTFTGQYKPRNFFDRKVQNTGYTRTLSIGKIIPKEWKYVRLTVIEKTNTYVVVKIDKLLGENTYAHITSTGAESKSNA